MRHRLAALLAVLLATPPLWADDFDFGEDFEEESSWSFPLRGSLGFGAGYQVGEPKQLVSLELLSTFVLDWSSSFLLNASNSYPACVAIFDICFFQVAYACVPL